MLQEWNFTNAIESFNQQLHQITKSKNQRFGANLGPALHVLGRRVKNALVFLL